MIESLATILTDLWLSSRHVKIWKDINVLHFRLKEGLFGFKGLDAWLFSRAATIGLFLIGHLIMERVRWWATPQSPFDELVISPVSFHQLEEKK